VNFWKKDPKFKDRNKVMHYHPLKGEDLYKWQTNHLANALLIQDYDASVDVDVYDLIGGCNFNFPNKGELISGSFMSKTVTQAHSGSAAFEAADIDIYFKTKEDAQSFCRLNQMYGFEFSNPMCSYGAHDVFKFNLIYGVEYDTPAHLISRFDIRACAMAYDPKTELVHIVRGAIQDCIGKEIYFNPVPRGVSIRRLVKYVEKGFKISDKHQRLFFSELVRSPIYSPELEIITGY